MVFHKMYIIDAVGAQIFQSLDLVFPVILVAERRVERSNAAHFKIVEWYYDFSKAVGHIKPIA